MASYQLTFNGVSATITYIASTFIKTTVPFHASSGPIVLTYQGNTVKGSGLHFDVNPTEPNITSYSVYSGIVGTPMTIAGSGFDQSGPPLEVAFGGTKAKIVSYDQNIIYTSVPHGAISGPISVTAGGISTIGFNLTFRVVEVVSEIKPRHAKVGDTIEVKGTGFYTYFPDSYYWVQFPNGATVNVKTTSDTTLKFVLPINATSGFATIHSSYNLSISFDLPYLGLIPTITKIEPDTVFAGRPNPIFDN